jgi:UDP-3-O-[3-hydroxymyristoyl] glucosamine N-acyltransferase
MKWSLSVKELLEWLGDVSTEGDFAGNITAIADMRKAGPGELTFLASRKFARFLGETQASVVILVPEDLKATPAPGQLYIRSTDPSMALAVVCGHLEEWLKPAHEPGIHPTAVVHREAEVDPSASIGPHCHVAKGVHIAAGVVLKSSVGVEQEAWIGEGTHIGHGASIGWGCRIGSECRIFSGAVIGADGYGYHSDKTGHRPLPQIGIVVIEDKVDVGANSCIDRARFAETRIGEGTKIDNLVQIGHNVTIGRHCIICSQVGVAGSTEIGDFVVFAGQVGVNGHIKVGDGVTATGQTGVSKDTPPGVVLSGTPSRPHREELRRQALLKQLPNLLERVKKLEQGEAKD